MDLYDDKKDKVFTFRWNSLHILIMYILQTLKTKCRWCSHEFTVWWLQKWNHNDTMRNGIDVLAYSLYWSLCCLYGSCARQYNSPIPSYSGSLSLLWRVAVMLDWQEYYIGQSSWCVGTGAPFWPAGVAQLFIRIRHKHGKFPNCWSFCGFQMMSVETIYHSYGEYATEVFI